MSRAGSLHRVVPRRGGTVAIVIDGRPAEAFAGESLLLAMLAQAPRLRRHEADGAPRAGFCLMGACQDCWVWRPDGRRLRACTTKVADGMQVLTGPPEVRDA
jgi:NADH dehydrogenase/NADH:ubiquinone oxidoreductase subunit G